MKNIRILLDRYWEGETNLEEERELKAYFNSGQIADEFQDDAAFFQALQQERQVQYMRKAIRLPLPIHWSVRPYAATAAAALLLLLTAWWVFKKPASAVMDLAQQNTSNLISAPEMKPQSVDKQEYIAQKPQEVKVVNTVKKVKKHAPKSSGTNPEAAIVVHNPETDLDPETRQAYEEVRAALALVSSKISKGKKAAARQINHVETLDKFIKKKGDI